MGEAQAVRRSNHHKPSITERSQVTGQRQCMTTPYGQRHFVPTSQNNTITITNYGEASHAEGQRCQGACGRGRRHLETGKKKRVELVVYISLGSKKHPRRSVSSSGTSSSPLDVRPRQFRMHGLTMKVTRSSQLPRTRTTTFAFHPSSPLERAEEGS